MRGLDGLFVPIVVMAGATLVAVWAGRLLGARLEQLERYGRHLEPHCAPALRGQPASLAIEIRAVGPCV